MNDDSRESEASDELAPQRGLSIDGLIRWVDSQRSVHPHRRLASLIDLQGVSHGVLVELAAVDLIGQRRRGVDWQVEDYLREFPFLEDHSSLLLDLIDAELCVRREMQEKVSIESLIQRFPDLEPSIRQLFFLNTSPKSNPSERIQPPSRESVEEDLLVGQPSQAVGEGRSKPQQQIVDLVGLRGGGLPRVGTETGLPGSRRDEVGNQVAGPEGATIAFEENRESDADEFLLQRDLTVAGGHRKVASGPPTDAQEDSIDVPIPIRPPQWMTAARCVSTAQCESGRYWLVKGRDSERGESVAMKIIPLPVTIGRKERTRILDLCESTSSVSHPAWIPPRIAAINNGYLAVVRPWIFGRDFVLNRLSVDGHGRLAMLARVAYALSAAHRVGATHGSVKPGNIVIDHESQVNLVEPASGVAGWEFNLSVWDNDLARNFPLRVRRDCTALVHLIYQEIIESPSNALHREFSRLVEKLDFADQDACATIGEHVQAMIDGTYEQRSWWRR